MVRTRGIQAAASCCIPAPATARPASRVVFIHRIHQLEGGGEERAVANDLDANPECVAVGFDGRML